MLTNEQKCIPLILTDHTTNNILPTFDLTEDDFQ